MGPWEASGSVTAEYTMGTSSTTSAAYAIDNTANKKGVGGSPQLLPLLGEWGAGHRVGTGAGEEMGLREKEGEG